jgi:hypothetical protein
MSSQGLSGRPAPSKTSGSSLDESMGPSMHRQPPLNGPIQVVGHAAPPGLLALWPITAGRDHHAKPTLHDRDQRCHGPARAVDGAGTGPVPLAARGAPAQARRATCSQSSRFPVITPQLSRYAGERRFSTEYGQPTSSNRFCPCVRVYDRRRTTCDGASDEAWWCCHIQQMRYERLRPPAKSFGEQGGKVGGVGTAETAFGDGLTRPVKFDTKM